MLRHGVWIGIEAQSGSGATVGLYGYFIEDPRNN